MYEAFQYAYSVNGKKTNGGIPIMKKIVTPLLLLSLTAFIASSALAAEGGNPRKGKHLYKKNCKSCHSADGAGGALRGG